MEPDLLQLIIVNVPNYIGFTIALFMLWRIVNRLLDDDDDDD